MTTYSWDYENRMESVILPSGDRHTFSYDAHGKRIETETPSNVTKFTWDLENVLAEFNSGGATNRRYTHEPAKYGNLLSHKTSTDNLYYHFDALGSTRLTTSASAVASSPFIYAAFGDMITAPATPGTPYQWVGQLGYQFDPETLLNYIRARFYDPATGMWFSEDPLGMIQSFRFQNEVNLYRYAMNNPMLLSDPSGMIAWFPVLVGVIIIGYAVYEIWGWFSTPAQGCDCVVFLNQHQTHTDRCIMEYRDTKDKDIVDFYRKYHCGQVLPVVNPQSEQGAIACCIYQNAKEDPNVDFEDFKRGWGDCLNSYFEIISKAIPTHIPK